MKRGCQCGGDMPGFCPGPSNCPANMPETTGCWSCNQVFGKWDDKCPHCNATNANVDFDLAMKEQMEAA